MTSTINKYSLFFILLLFLSHVTGQFLTSNDKYYNNNIDMINYTEEYIDYMFKELNVNEKETPKDIENLIGDYLSNHEVIRMGIISLNQMDNFKNKWKAHTLLNPVIHGIILQDWKKGKTLYYSIIEVDETFIVILKINNIILISY